MLKLLHVSHPFFSLSQGSTVPEVVGLGCRVKSLGSTEANDQKIHA